MDVLPRAIFPVAFNWNQWVGIPSTQYGDCWEFIRALVLAALGVDLSPSQPDITQMKEAALSQGAWMPLPPDVRHHPFDVLIFDLEKGRAPHVGVVITPGNFIHCLAGTESTVDSSYRAFWQHRLSEVYRYTP